MKILAIDPGNEISAWVIFDGKDIIGKGIDENDWIIHAIQHENGYESDLLAIEMIASYGMPVGKSVFETCVWIGRFVQFYDFFTKGKFHYVYRKDVKMHFCNSMRAKDSNIRQALIDRFGKPGTKKNPGLLYGVSKDIWSALAIAVYQYDIMNK